MSEFVIFDSSVIIDDLRTLRHQHKIQTTAGVVRNSSVVLSELWRGAGRPSEKEFLRALAKNHPILTPTERNWIESGQLLAEMRSKFGFTAEKLRDFHFDLLIALTARSHGARVITSNRADFEIIRRYLQFELEVW
jgi:predicted nucleic acid-binding protein